MSIKVPHPINSIILEGLWGLGKTQLAQAYCTQYAYKLVPEPLHTHELKPREISDLNSWYLRAHQNREHFLEDSSPVILERSILSTFAFLYALERPLPDLSHISRLRNVIKKNKILIAYLNLNKNFSFWEKENLKEYHPDIQNILEHEDMRLRYQEWYEVILPQKHGILPFHLRMIQNSKRRETNDLVHDIYLSLACKRVAQINTVCFTKDLDKGKIQILILRRNPQKGGFFQTVTGGICPGESAHEAAKRETAEEIGIPEQTINPFWTPFTYSFLGDDGYPLDEYVFGCEIQNPALINISQEHENFAWVTPEKAKELLKFDSNRRAIDEVIKKTGQPNGELSR